MTVCTSSQERTTVRIASRAGHRLPFPVAFLAALSSHAAPKSPAIAADTRQAQITMRLESCNLASATRVFASVKMMPAHPSASEHSAKASHDTISLTGRSSHFGEIPNTNTAITNATVTR